MITKNFSLTNPPPLSTHHSHSVTRVPILQSNFKREPFGLYSPAGNYRNLYQNPAVTVRDFDPGLLLIQKPITLDFFTTLYLSLLKRSFQGFDGGDLLYPCKIDSLSLFVSLNLAVALLILFIFMSKPFRIKSSCLFLNVIWVLIGSVDNTNVDVLDFGICELGNLCLWAKTKGEGLSPIWLRECWILIYFCVFGK